MINRLLLFLKVINSMKMMIKLNTIVMEELKMKLKDHTISRKRDSAIKLISFSYGCLKILICSVSGRTMKEKEIKPMTSHKQECSGSTEVFWLKDFTEKDWQKGHTGLALKKDTLYTHGRDSSKSTLKHITPKHVSFVWLKF